MKPFNRHFVPSRALLPSLLAVSIAGAALPAMAEEQGFVEDAQVNLNLRNFYFNRNFTNPTKAQGKAEEWTQSFILDAKSGFTQGTIGVGLDVLGMYSVKLDGAVVRQAPSCSQYPPTGVRPITSGAWGWHSKPGYRRPS